MQSDVGSKLDDGDKRHKNIIVKSAASVTRGIIAVHNDIHNVYVGVLPQKCRCRYDRREMLQLRATYVTTLLFNCYGVPA